MPADVELRCECGTMRGVASDVAGRAGNRLICMCDDCQTYAQWIGPERVLDQNGGTEVYQTTPSQLRLTEGADRLRCLRLSPRGLMRWYAGCCKTPVANCLDRPKLPFAGLHMRFVDPSVDAASRDEIFGPVLARVQARWGKPPLPADAHPRAPLWLIVRSVRQLAGGFLRGRHSPTPFYVAETGEPVVEPTVLPLEERRRLRALVGPI